jgi:hypothetical protein
MFFGKKEIGFDVTSSRFPGETRHFDRFSEPLKEIIDARIWAGLHYRTARCDAVVRPVSWASSSAPEGWVLPAGGRWRRPAAR